MRKCSIKTHRKSCILRYFKNLCLLLEMLSFIFKFILNTPPSFDAHQFDRKFHITACDVNDPKTVCVTSKTRAIRCYSIMSIRLQPRETAPNNWQLHKTRGPAAVCPGYFPPPEITISRNARAPPKVAVCCVVEFPLRPRDTSPIFYHEQ